MTTALEFFAAKLTHETDASDVYQAQKDGADFALVDVRSAEAWAQGHAAGAVHLPYHDIAARAEEVAPQGTPVVVYCWSPGCNAGAKGALEFAKRGYEVREMIGGYEYWVREGLPTETEAGPAARVFDRLVMVVREDAG